MAEQGVITRIRRGFIRMGAFVSAVVRGARPYRFDAERSNHADQAAQTHVSLGLMAAAAQQTDDDSLRQTLQTEHTLRSRLAVLESNRAMRGLTLEEGWERASIIRGIEALGTPATLEALGPQRLSAFGAVGQRRSLLGPLALPGVWGVLSSPLAWVVIAFALPATWGAWEKGRADRLEGRLEDVRGDLANRERDLIAANAERDLFADAVSAADAQSRQSAEMIEQERRRRLRAEAVARRIQRDMEAARAGQPVDYGFGGVRDAGAPDGSPGPGSSDATRDHPG